MTKMFLFVVTQDKTGTSSMRSRHLIPTAEKHFKLNPLLDMPILGSTSSATKKDMMSKIWTNGDTIICLSRKHNVFKSCLLLMC